MQPSVSSVIKIILGIQLNSRPCSAFSLVRAKGLMTSLSDLLAPAYDSEDYRIPSFKGTSSLRTMIRAGVGCSHIVPRAICAMACGRAIEHL